MGGDFVSKLTKGLKFKDQETQTCSSNKGSSKVMLTLMKSFVIITLY